METRKILNHFLKSLTLQKFEWLSRRIFLLIVTLIIFIFAVVWREPIHGAAAMQINQQISEQDLRLVSGSAHYLPGSEMEKSLNFNTKQTNGVILGAAIVLFTILIGVSTGSYQISPD